MTVTPYLPDITRSFAVLDDGTDLSRGAPYAGSNKISHLVRVNACLTILQKFVMSLTATVGGYTLTHKTHAEHYNS